MSSTNKTTYYELSQYVGTDKPTYLGDYNADMLAIDTGLHEASTDASTALSTANSAASTASDAATSAATAVTTANSALSTASTAQTTAETASTNASAALTAASAAETAAEANTITNLAPAYDATLTYDVGDLVTYIDGNGSGKLYKCIVAVTAPMAFNINYWDDVTTSEVYEKIKRTVSVIADGTMNYSEILNQFYSTLNSVTDLTKCYITRKSETALTSLMFEYSSSGDFSFSHSHATTTSVAISGFIIRESSSAFHQWVIDANSNSHSTLSTTVPAASTVFTLHF